MLEASGSLALRTRMSDLRERLIGFSNLVLQSGDSLGRVSQGFTYSPCSSAADHVVTIEGRLQRNAHKKISIEFHAKLFQFFDREIAQFASFVETIADGVADLFMGFAKGHS